MSITSKTTSVAAVSSGKWMRRKKSLTALPYYSCKNIKWDCQSTDPSIPRTIANIPIQSYEEEMKRFFQRGLLTALWLSFGHIWIAHQCAVASMASAVWPWIHFLSPAATHRLILFSSQWKSMSADKIVSHRSAPSGPVFVYVHETIRPIYLATKTKSPSW